MLPRNDICYRALATRDARFDGRFFTGVTTTGIFCRPVCPASTPKPQNCRFFESAAAAVEAGFRPCLRCRPEVAPRFTGAPSASPVVQRALAMIAEGALEDATIGTIAAELDVTERHLRRLFVKDLGASPLAIVQTRRLLFAKQLLDETALPIIEVSMAAGFRSLRRFNEVIRTTYNAAPRDLRRMRTAATSIDASTITLRLPYSPPYHWEAMLSYLRARATAGVESVRDGLYRRTIAVDGDHGTVAVGQAARGNYLIATINIPRITAIAAIVDRLRLLFDLGANVAEIGAHLGTDPLLAPLVTALPGLRVPGTWDRFELAVRAILGQQVSVAAATTLAGRLAAAYGAPLAMSVAGQHDPDLHRIFPTPEALASADLTSIGLTRARAAAVSSFAAAYIADRNLLRDTMSLNDCAERRLTGLPGIGAWTAQYIAMRALGQPDAFPATDLGIRRAIERIAGAKTPKEIAALADRWRPWRSYAAFHLWHAPASHPSFISYSSQS